MKKIIAELILLTNKSLYPIVYCLDDNGLQNEAISMTLCNAIWELRGKPLLELQRLINLVDSGECHPIDQSLADMSINDKLIWLRSSLAGNSKIYISNENIPEYSVEGGVPQCFSSEQLNVVIKLVSEFELEICTHGKDRLLGNKLEIEFPES
ncbi:hypothetical protein [Acinetobacter sp. ANC 4805]|uniref:hypothetical protein n=1 Tax=Acinetobacter sp. ANC 4805 TaxID=2923425 RepID=UPI001F4B5F62|nr:hypothetical protein [Acinetobacter sp. ANC 4805]MCH7310325.1 hypothetical protein [Acinetobacter sp. ANC 4805]